MMNSIPYIMIASKLKKEIFVLLLFLCVIFSMAIISANDLNGDGDLSVNDNTKINENYPLTLTESNLMNYLKRFMERIL